jgi:hypothetical protein
LKKLVKILIIFFALTLSTKLSSISFTDIPIRAKKIIYDGLLGEDLCMLFLASKSEHSILNHPNFCKYMGIPVLALEQEDFSLEFFSWPQIYLLIKLERDYSSEKNLAIPELSDRQKLEKNYHLLASLREKAKNQGITALVLSYGAGFFIPIGYTLGMKDNIGAALFSVGAIFFIGAGYNLYDSYMKYKKLESAKYELGMAINKIDEKILVSRDFLLKVEKRLGVKLLGLPDCKIDALKRDIDKFFIRCFSLVGLKKRRRSDYYL